MEVINRLKKIIEEKRITLTTLAMKSGFSRQHIARILKGETNVGIESLEMICEACGIKLSDLYTESSLSSGIKIPVIGRIPAGIPIEAVEEILDYEEITPEMARTGEYFALKVQGDSMAPQIMNGDILIIKKQDSAESGDVCVVFVNGDDATLKRLQKDENGIALIPNNPAYGIRYFTNKEIETLPIRIVGKAVEVRRSLI
ncbi:MAG: helix-turn-helix domain-containing protein [Candidatus Gastranaerophilales bacterium]|nr:helix-turn-helix domain-containing protein [Alphaproteobacteria bacterium]MBQ8886816.1 helix-turn-helix domain-containing protein [Candidatus Gastranaerophilales bacterium]